MSSIVILNDFTLCVRPQGDCTHHRDYSFPSAKVFRRWWVFLFTSVLQNVHFAGGFLSFQHADVFTFFLAVVETKPRHLSPRRKKKVFGHTCSHSLTTLKACGEFECCKEYISIYLAWLCRHPPRLVAATCCLSIWGQIRNRCSSLTEGSSSNWLLLFKERPHIQHTRVPVTFHWFADAYAVFFFFLPPAIHSPPAHGSDSEIKKPWTAVSPAQSAHILPLRRCHCEIMLLLL